MSTGKLLAIIAVVAIILIGAVAAVMLMGGGGGPDGEIDVTSPATDTTHQAGVKLDIRWTKSGETGSNVKIEYGAADRAFITIIESTPNDGLFTWYIFEGQEPLDTYFIKVTSLSDPSIFGTSGVFAIIESNLPIEGSVMITNPVEGASYLRGSVLTITWSTMGRIGPDVKLEYLRPGAEVVTIVESTPNVRSYNWRMPSDMVPHDDFRIRIRSVANDTISDVSDAFTITDGRGGPEVQVGHFLNYTTHLTSSNGFETLQMDGFYHADVMEMNETAINFNLTVGWYYQGEWEITQHEEWMNLTDSFFGFIGSSKEFENENIVLNYEGMDWALTPWGNRNCEEYSIIASMAPNNQNGTMWVFHTDYTMSYQLYTDFLDGTWSYYTMEIVDSNMLVIIE